MTQEKVSGIKRHIVVDAMGLPHAIAVTTADVTDRDGAIQMILLNLDNLSHVEKFLVDGPVKIGLNQKHPTARGALV